MARVSVIILTYNESLHIKRCIESVRGFAHEIFVVDSPSTDDTQQLAEAAGAKVVVHPFSTQAEQFNWALDHLPIEGDWVMRMDADEYVLPALAEEINGRLDQIPAHVNGVNVKRRVIFQGRWIKWGGYYPTILLRLFRRGTARSEQRLMDEHIRLTDGESVTFKHDIVDENLNDLTWWTDKHNRYANREAADVLLTETGSESHDAFHASTKQAERKRWLKTRVYNKLPFGFRPLMYFVYRYFVRLGLLDGRAGLTWHGLQGLWYRFLVDAKLKEMQRSLPGFDGDARRLLSNRYNIHIEPKAEPHPDSDATSKHKISRLPESAVKAS